MVSRAVSHGDREDTCQGASGLSFPSRPTSRHSQPAVGQPCWGRIVSAPHPPLLLWFPRTWWFPKGWQRGWELAIVGLGPGLRGPPWLFTSCHNGTEVSEEQQQWGPGLCPLGVWRRGFVQGSGSSTVRSMYFHTYLLLVSGRKRVCERVSVCLSSVCLSVVCLVGRCRKSDISPAPLW